MKAHQQYKNKEGVIVPGATTVLNILNKPALMHWAWSMGMAGNDYRKVSGRAAGIGTIAHEMIECDIRGVEFDAKPYPPNDIDKAENAYLAWLDWRKSFSIEPVASEIQLVSEEFQYGGTLDLVAKKDNELWMIDFKTGSGIYDEAKYQVSAYKNLWDGNNTDKIKQVNIIRLEKEDGAFEHHVISETELMKGFAIFLHCLGIYNLQKKKGGNNGRK